MFKLKSVFTSVVDLDSKPEAVKRAYSSSATEEESTLTALVFAIPKVKVSCLVSTSVSKSCNAPLIVSLSAIVEPLKVPRLSEASETPERVIKWSTSKEAFVWSELFSFVLSCVTVANPASLASWLINLLAELS